MDAAEIRALAGLLDELDYYQLLETKRDVSTSELKQAYYDLSRRFHPDVMRHQPSDLRASGERIAKRLTEAWSVLRDPRRRRAYDQKLSAGDGVRIQLGEAEAVAEKKSVEERLGTTPNGRRYFTLAHTDIDLIASVPTTVVLSACEVGRSSVRWGEEAIGMTRIWLHAGTAALAAYVGWYAAPDLRA